MPILPTPFLDIEYEECGSRTDPTVILVHGFPDSLRSWDAVVQHLRYDPIHLLIPHVRGFGATRVKVPEAEGGQWAALGQDIIDFADAFKLDRFLLAGHDWGARAGYAAAALAPKRVLGLVALATPYVMFRGQRESPAQARAYWYQWYLNTDHGRQAFEADPAAFCEYLWRTWSPDWNFSPYDFKAARIGWTNPQFIATVISCYRHRYGNAPAAPLYARQQQLLDSQPRLAVPTWFACGLSDACNLAASSKGQEHWFNNNFERSELSGAGHFLQRERPEQVADLIRRAVALS
jgi:pimeloyl-ACP methyl ester carboxylesterase